MPIMRYKTDYPNQVHQLLVSVSRHFYILKSGDVSYQKKPFEFDLKTVRKSEKVHVIHYLLKDHYSGVFYAEICTHLDLIPVEEFLFRAWSKQDNIVFCGIPMMIIVPKSVQEFAPGLRSFLNTIQIEQIDPTSGYQAGVREISIWEDEIRTALAFSPRLKSFTALKHSTSELITRLIQRGGDKNSRISKWNDKIKQVNLPTELMFFKEHYATATPVKERRAPLGNLEFVVDDLYEDVEGRFEWGKKRDRIFQRFFDAEELLDDGYEVRGKSVLKKIIIEDPQFIDAYNSLGFLEINAGKYSNALKIFKQAFAIGSRHIPDNFVGKIIWGMLDNRPFLRAMHGLGICYLKTDDLAKANAIFEKMLKYNPNDNQGIRALAIQSNIALKQYSTVLSICSKYPDDAMADTLYGRVLALYKTAKVQEAAKALEEAIKYLPLVARELVKRQHIPMNGEMPGSMTWGGADEAYEYWHRVGKYWEECAETLDFVRRGLLPSGK